jgi:hypothetical protein
MVCQEIIIENVLFSVTFGNYCYFLRKLSTGKVRLAKEAKMKMSPFYVEGDRKVGCNFEAFTYLIFRSDWKLRIIAQNLE